MENKRQPTLAVLFLSFLRLGLTAFGGPVMVVYIKELAVMRRRWLDEDIFRDGVALVQSVPGATAMQMAAYVGLRTRGIPGAACSYLGFGLPAFLLMLALSALYVRTRETAGFVSLFAGLQVIVVAIVANAAWIFGRETVRGMKVALIGAASTAALWLGVNSFFVIAGAALVGIVLLRKPPAMTAGGGEARLEAWKPFALLALPAAGLAALYACNRELFRLGALMGGIGVVSFGGGYAALSIMHNQVVNVQGWLQSQAFMDGIALGQVTPGPILNTSTFVGYLVFGLPGAVVATVAIFGASLLVLLLVAPFFDRLRGSRLFRGVIGGILASFVGLLVYITVKFAAAVPWDVARVLLAAAALLALLRKVDILYVVLVGAAVSLLLFR